MSRTQRTISTLPNTTSENNYSIYPYAFNKNISRDKAHLGNTFLIDLVERYGSLDLLGASWEGQSVSKAGHQRGAVNPRSLFIYNMNIYPGEVCTSEVTKARKLVHTLLGEPTLIDGADLGVATHRVRLFWSNKLPAPILQATLPKKLPPFPVLQNLLQPYHTPTRQGHTYQYPFVKQNRVGYERMYMPARVSYLESNAFRPKRN